MKKITKLVAVVMASAMLLTACGSTANKDTASEGTTGGAPEVTTEATQGDNKAPDKIVVGTNAEFPPFEFVNDSGEIDGFDMAVMKEVAKRIGSEIEINNMEFKGLIGAMEAGHLDVIAAGMTVTPDKERSVDFTDSYYMATQYIVVQKDSPVTSFKDLEGKKIGVQEGTTGDYIASDEFGESAGVKNADVQRLKKGADAIMALKNGGVDAVIIDANPAKEFVNANPDKLKYVEDPNAPQEEYAFAVKKGNDALKTLINDALAEMKSDGTFDKFVAEYIG